MGMNYDNDVVCQAFNYVSFLPCGEDDPFDFNWLTQNHLNTCCVLNRFSMTPCHACLARNSSKRKAWWWTSMSLGCQQPLSVSSNQNNLHWNRRCEWIHRGQILMRTIELNIRVTKSEFVVSQTQIDLQRCNRFLVPTFSLTWPPRQDSQNGFRGLKHGFHWQLGDFNHYWLVLFGDWFQHMIWNVCRTTSLHLITNIVFPGKRGCFSIHPAINY